MNDDNIIPYQTSPTLTVKQAVMYMLGFRGQYEFDVEGDWMEFDLSDYLHNLQEETDCAYRNAIYELEMLKRDNATSPEAMDDATRMVETTKLALEQAQKLPNIAESYRQVINHEFSRARRGKRTPLIVDEDETASSGELRITKASFLEWLEDIEFDADGNATPLTTEYEIEKLLSESLSPKATESLYVTLGLLVSMLADKNGGKFGSGDKPNIINTAGAIEEYAKELYNGYKLHGQGSQSIRKRIEVALFALKAAC